MRIVISSLHFYKIKVLKVGRRNWTLRRQGYAFVSGRKYKDLQVYVQFLMQEKSIEFVTVGISVDFYDQFIIKENRGQKV